jgi:outer membrane immunogenic protein
MEGLGTLRSPVDFDSKVRILPSGFRPFEGNMRNSNLIISAAIVVTAIIGIGAASAADLPARTYTKAPAMVDPGYNWTGFYIFGGGGGGIWGADSYGLFTASGVQNTTTLKTGGDGWFGTVGAGYDWQFNSSWVAGIFADGTFGKLSGTITDPGQAVSGTEKMRDSWAAGVRLGYLVAPNVLSYVNGGYTGSQWSSATLTSNFAGGPGGIVSTPSFNRNGWFVGGGVENNLNIFGIAAPGWFMKTEYRAAYYDRTTLAETAVANGVLTGLSVTFKPFVETVSTSLVYRFNWSGPVVAKY